jgi:hypothetical protein
MFSFEAFCFVLGPVTAGQTTVYIEYQIREHEFNAKEIFIFTDSNAPKVQNTAAL